MPIYDYVCSACRHRIEVIHGINAPGPQFCPSCGKPGTMHKAMVSPAVHFKGSGWAKKDRSSASRARARSGAGGSPGDKGDGAASTSDGTSGDGTSGEGTRQGKKGDDATKPNAGDAAKPSPSTEA